MQEFFAYLYFMSSFFASNTLAKNVPYYRYAKFLYKKVRDIFNISILCSHA